jgi:hypothetical protein
MGVNLKTMNRVIKVTANEIAKINHLLASSIRQTRKIAGVAWRANRTISGRISLLISEGGNEEGMFMFRRPVFERIGKPDNAKGLAFNVSEYSHRFSSPVVAMPQLYRMTNTLYAGKALGSG